MDIHKAKLLIRNRFAELEEKDPEGRIHLNALNSPDLFSNFTDHDVSTLKELNYGSEFFVKTRANEQNINKFAIYKVNPNQL